MDPIFNFYLYLIETVISLFYYDYTLVANNILKPISFALSVIFAFFTIWSIVKLREVVKSMKTPMAKEPIFVPKALPENIEGWNKIVEKSQSMDENQRKFAIIEADTLIDKILGLAGYDGENLGAKLKQVERGDIESLDDLWEAHKVRNRIAHEANYKLSQEYTKAAISRYEKVLKELEYI